MELRRVIKFTHIFHKGNTTDSLILYIFGFTWHVLLSTSTLLTNTICNLLQETRFLMIFIKIPQWSATTVCGHRRRKI